MLKQLAAFVEGIRASGLLRPEQVEQIAAWAAADNADPHVIAKDIVRNGWLTAFQVKMFWKGRGPELFLSQYVLLDRLGEGGMGEVFHARHRRMERDVALKVIRRERLAHPGAVKRFGREIQAAAKLVHENIVMAYDADQVGDRHFFAMEYVEGTTLAQLVKEKGPLPIEQACDCIRQAAVGLQHAFECGMVHRDIKPSNLLLSKKGVLKILDLGLARLLETPEGETESRITQEGLVVGTPDYLAPEQARKRARNTDIRADIYALGCTLYYLLCGHTPFGHGTPTEKMLKHTVEPIPPLTRPNVPPALAEIVYRMMAKQPEQHFQAPNEVAFALQEFAGSPSPMSSGAQPRPATVNPLASSTQHPSYQSPATPVPLATPVEETRADSAFHVPPVASNRNQSSEPRRSSWPIFVVAATLLVVAVAAGVFLFMRR